MPFTVSLRGKETSKLLAGCSHWHAAAAGPCSSRLAAKPADCLRRSAAGSRRRRPAAAAVCCGDHRLLIALTASGSPPSPPLQPARHKSARRGSFSIAHCPSRQQAAGSSPAGGGQAAALVPKKVVKKVVGWQTVFDFFVKFKKNRWSIQKMSFFKFF